MRRLLPAFAVLAAAPSAFAAADVEVTIAAPSGAYVYDQARYRVRVTNSGDRHARNVSVRIDLPETQTSPTVYVMGIVGSRHRRCAQDGTSVVCSFGRVKSGRTKTRWFKIAFPVSAAPLELHADVSTTSPEPNQANNSASHVASLLYYDTPVAGPRAAHNRHCTGQGLIGFYECTLFPTSISSHDITLEADGTISFAAAPASFTGTWSQVLPDRLAISYLDDGVLVAAFHGHGVGGDCFEGLTVFPGSPYVAPYEVCL